MTKRKTTQKLNNSNQKAVIDVPNIGKIRISFPVDKQELMAFDIGLLFTADSQQVQLYIDPDLREVIDHILKQHGQLILKTNFFSDDLLAITPQGPVSL